MTPSGGTGVEVGDWLRGLGLGQYEQAFRDNDIDARVLPGLTADDFREIGVVSVGHRRLMLQSCSMRPKMPWLSCTPPSDRRTTGWP